MAKLVWGMKLNEDEVLQYLEGVGINADSVDIDISEESEEDLKDFYIESEGYENQYHFDTNCLNVLNSYEKIILKDSYDRIPNGNTVYIVFEDSCYNHYESDDYDSYDDYYDTW